MRAIWKNLLGIFSILIASAIFLIPFAFILVTAAKNKQEAALLRFSWPTAVHAWDNLV